MFHWLHDHLSSQPARSAPLRRGFALGWVLSDDARQVLLNEPYVRALRESGADMARVDFRLGRHPRWDETILRQYERVLQLLGDAGIAVLGLAGHGVVATPQQAQWTANNAEAAGGDGHNAFVDAYVSTVGDLVAHFRGRVSVWELWNEPNVWTHQEQRGGTAVYSGGSYIYPSNYAVLLARAYRAIKGQAGLRDVMLVSGGLLAHNNGGATNAHNSGAPYLQAVYEAGRHGPADWEGVRRELGSYPLDATGQHLYLDRGGKSSADHVRAYLGWLRQAQEAYEGTGTAKPIYVTETGWKTTAVSPQVQAANLSTLYSACADVPYVAGVLWFQVADNAAAHLDYGVTDAHWNHKPAFAAFQQVAAH